MLLTIKTGKELVMMRFSCYNYKMTTVQYITVESDRAGQRIDNFLIAYFKLPKKLIYRWLRKGEVRLNKKRIKHTYRVQAGDLLRIPPFTAVEDKKTVQVCQDHLQYLESLILYENNDYLIINKPSGIAVHGGSGIHSGLIERLRVLRPYAKKLELAHRLDKETSGCLIIAKKYSVLTQFHHMLRNRQIKKIYHAVVHGRWPEKTTKIDLPLKRHVLPHGERVVRVDHNEGKDALTTVKILKHLKCCSLLEASPHTGRTHQIRVHLATHSHPIICDKKYGFAVQDNQFYTKEFKRLFLHAYTLKFNDPITSKIIEIKAPYDRACKDFLHTYFNMKPTNLNGKLYIDPINNTGDLKLVTDKPIR